MRYLTGGESHGPCLISIIEGLPAGLFLSSAFIDTYLRQRQGGYGRGPRMKLESDRVEFLSGLRFNRTLGSPLTLKITNRDFENWKEVMGPEGERPPGVHAITRPRPGHADFSGGVKYLRSDLRDILERSSARETAARVAVGSVARRFLQEMDVSVYGHVLSIGGVEAGKAELDALEFTDLQERANASQLRCADPSAEAEMVAGIDKARGMGDTLGGVFEVIVTGLPPGLGSHVHPDRRLDGRMAGALMSLQGIKGVEIGLGFASAFRRGSEVHDPFHTGPSGMVYRSSNRAGGIEGGISNGEPVRIRAAMKPIPTLTNPLPSIDLVDLKEVTAVVERSDVCAVPAASVVGEAIAAWEIAVAFREKFAGDSMDEVKAAYEAYTEMVNRYLYRNDKGEL